MTDDTPSSVRFHYRKGNFFRVIHVDGVIGGATPARDIFVALYNQRSPLPRMVEQRISPEGTLGEEINRQSKTGIFREMEVGFVLSAQTAREIGEFLLQQAKLIEDTKKIERQEVGEATQIPSERP